MKYEGWVKKGFFVLFLAAFFLSLSLSFAYAGEIASPCEECKATYVPGETKDINALIITDKNCSFCTTQMPQELLKSKFPGIKFETIDYKERQAKKLIVQHNIQTLPFFLIDSLIKEEKIFLNLKFFFEEGKNKKI